MGHSRAPTSWRVRAPLAVGPWRLLIVAGLGCVRHVSHRTHLTTLEADVSAKYLCLSALAALLDSVEERHKTSFVKGTLKIRFTPVKGLMLLDPVRDTHAPRSLI